MSGWGAYYLGMNYPFTLYPVWWCIGWINCYLSVMHGFQILLILPMWMGLLYLLLPLWILSIFGNYGDLNSWYNVKQYELLHWGILFAFVAIIAIVYGLKHDDATSRGFGITFLFLNLYTKYFEFFLEWDAQGDFLYLAGSVFLVDWTTCGKTLESGVLSPAPRTKPLIFKE